LSPEEIPEWSDSYRSLLLITVEEGTYVAYNGSPFKRKLHERTCMIEDTQKPMLRFLTILTAASMIGIQGYTILFNNFAVDVVHLEGRNVGIIQSIREVPGFLALLAVYVILVIREHRLSALSIAILGMGGSRDGKFSV
jgi:hypothetical protein